MNHFTIAAALTVALGLTAATANAAGASGGTITFTGAVTDQTCTISGGAGTNGGTDNFTVALNPVPASDLDTAAATAGKRPFQIIIGGPGQGTCVNGKVARLTFLTSSPQVDATNGTLINALTGEATNTNIQLLDSADAVIDLRNPANGIDSPVIANNTATIDMASQYYATDAATAGLVSTSVVYAVTYN